MRSSTLTNKKITAGMFMAALAILTAVYCFVAFIIMVLWGAIASGFDWRTISFGLSLLITAMLAVIGSFFKGDSK